MTTVERERRATAGSSSSVQMSKIARHMIPYVAALVLLAVWQIAVQLNPSVLLPSPVGIVASIPTVFATPSFWTATGETVLAIFQGLLIGCTVGTLLGVIIGRFRWVRDLTSLYVTGLYAMPLLAIVPLVTIWMGYSSAARLAVVIVAATLPSIVSTADGARNVPRDLEDASHVLRVSTWRRLFDLVLPATLPYVIAGVNVALGRVIVGAVAVEFLASVPGLANFILISARSFKQNEAFVGVLLLVAIGVVGHLLIELLRRKVAPWQKATTE